MKNNDKKFMVVITKKGSEKAKPSIWYAGKEGKIFHVQKSQQWPSVYEVTSGYYKGKIIDPPDCKLMPQKQEDKRSVANPMPKEQNAGNQVG